MTDDEAVWPAPWVRAALDAAILSCLRGGELHGYAIAVRLQQAGMGRLKGGSLYPTLARLEQDGYVSATWVPGESGPGRKVYGLTPAGARERDRLAQAWTSLGHAIERLALPEGD